MSPSTRITDLFISYSNKDAEFVERLAKDLLSSGVKVWWDKMEMKVGDSLNKKIQEGISNSAWLGVVLSPNSVSSPWVERELNSAHTKELEIREVFVLPILYQDCQIPLFLRDKIYADFRGSYEQGLAALLERINSPIKPEILRGLMSGDPSLISSSFTRINSKSRDRYCDELVNKLGSSSVGERVAALMSLFVIRHKSLLSHLLRMAKDPSNSVRRFAVFYLGELRAKHSIGIISELLSDKSPDVRAAARKAYKKIIGRST